MKTDNRWSPGASGATVPSDTPAAYSARWIDYESRADIVPDRQGFAYDETADRDRLIDLLQEAAYHTDLPHLQRDETYVAGHHPDWVCYMRRAGGYVYVDAWLTPC